MRKRNSKLMDRFLLRYDVVETLWDEIFVRLNIKLVISSGEFFLTRQNGLQNNSRLAIILQKSNDKHAIGSYRLECIDKIKLKKNEK